MPASLPLGPQTTAGSHLFRIRLDGVSCSVSVWNQRVVLESTCGNDPFFLWQTQSFSGLPLLCCLSPLRVSSWQSAPVVSLESDPQSLSLSIQPPLSAAGMQTNISGWEVLVSVDLCGEFSSFCLPSTCCFLHSPLKFQSTRHPCPQGSF